METDGKPSEMPAPRSESNAETERLRAENDNLKMSLLMRDAREELVKALEKAGARSPLLLFDSAKGDLQFADDGQLINAAAILQHLKNAHPEQFGFEKPTGSVEGGAGNGVSNYLTKEALARMAPADIAKLDWSEVRNVLAG